jgi:hypothetical protein
MITRILRSACLALLLSPVSGLAAEAMLLDETALSAKLDQAQDYQLLDARNAEAQRNAPIAFSTRYQKTMPIKKGLVLIVADTDAAALDIAKAIPAAKDCSVFAVKGGSEAWQRVMAKVPQITSVSGSFVIPMNTCEQGKPIQKLKRDKPLQQFDKK